VNAVFDADAKDGGKKGLMADDKGRDGFLHEDDAVSPCPDEILMAGYLDGKLDKDELARMEAHLAVCASCREEAAELREILAEGEILPESPEGEKALADLIKSAKNLSKK